MVPVHQPKPKLYKMYVACRSKEFTFVRPQSKDRDELEPNGKHVNLRMQHHRFEYGPSEKMLYGTEHWD